MKLLTVGGGLFFFVCSYGSEWEERLYSLLPVDYAVEESTSRIPVSPVCLRSDPVEGESDKEEMEPEMPSWGRGLGQLFGSTFNENWVIVRSLLVSIGRKAALVSGNEADCCPAIERAACVLQRDLVASMHSAVLQIRHLFDKSEPEVVKQVARLRALPGDFIQQAIYPETLAVLVPEEETYFADSFARQYMWWAVDNMKREVWKKRAPNWGALAFDGTDERPASPDLSPEYDIDESIAWLEVLRATFGCEYLVGNRFWKVERLLQRYVCADESMLVCVQRLQRDLCGRCVGAISAGFPEIGEEFAGRIEATELFLQQNKIRVSDFLRESCGGESFLMEGSFDTFATRYADWARQKYREQRIPRC